MKRQLPSVRQQPSVRMVEEEMMEDVEERFIQPTPSKLLGAKLKRTAEVHVEPAPTQTVLDLESDEEEVIVPLKVQRKRKAEEDLNKAKRAKVDDQRPKPVANHKKRPRD